jgi:beta-lactamase class A
MTPVPRRGWLALATLCLTWLLPRNATAQEPVGGAQVEHLQILAEKYRSELARIAQTVPGVMGIAAIDLTTGEVHGTNENLVFPQGSAIKIPILLELYRQAGEGRLRLEERVQVRAAGQVGGSGILQRFGDGTSELSVRDIAVLMIVLSDNTATNLLIDRLGMERVNRTMHEMGLSSVRLQRSMIQPEESARGNENLATPRDAAMLMSRIARCDLPVSAPGCAEIREILEIPKDGAFRRPIPAGVPVAWKPGSIEGVSTAWGLVQLPGRPYALAVMINYSGGDAAQDAIRDASDASYRHFSHLARATAYGARVPLEVFQEHTPSRPPR